MIRALSLNKASGYSMMFDEPELSWSDLSVVTDRDIRHACGYLIDEGWELEAERVLDLWQAYERLKEENARLHRQLNTQVPINIEHSKH